jgi:DNA-binding winged helix-turn-helix (wHTH) protein
VLHCRDFVAASSFDAGVGGRHHLEMVRHIVRVFDGVVRQGAVEEFGTYLAEVVAPEMASRRGVLGFDAVVDRASDNARFLVTTTWNGLTELRSFATEDWTSARVAPEEGSMLLSASVQHFERLHSRAYPNCGDIALDPNDRVVVIEGRRLELSPLEYTLLDALFARRGEVVTAGELAGRLWPGSAFAHAADVRRLVYRLRKLFDGSPRDVIQTRSGVGYVLVPPVKPVGPRGGRLDGRAPPA